MLLQPPAIVTTFTNVQFDLHISMFADAMWRDDGAAIIARGCHRNRACDRENMWSGNSKIWMECNFHWNFVFSSVFGWMVSDSKLLSLPTTHNFYDSIWLSHECRLFYRNIIVSFDDNDRVNACDKRDRLQMLIVTQNKYKHRAWETHILFAPWYEAELILFAVQPINLLFCVNIEEKLLCGTFLHILLCVSWITFPIQCEFLRRFHVHVAGASIVTTSDCHAPLQWARAIARGMQNRDPQSMLTAYFPHTQHSVRPCFYDCCSVLMNGRPSKRKHANAIAKSKCLLSSFLHIY